MKVKNNDNEMNITISSGGKSVTTSLANLKRFERLLTGKNKKPKKDKCR